jgi:membrane-associated phospholipid phosphatase
MALITVKPTALDERVAKAVSTRTNPEIEKAAKALTWGADEHVLLAACAIFWLASRRYDGHVRKTSSHCLITAVAASVLPHICKSLVDQQRPDRTTFARHRRGIPRSGKANDAFPSGHAVHMGALASFATLLPRDLRNGIWICASVLMTTRVVLLAHWVTDVAAGFVAGVGLERAIRRMTHPAPLKGKHPEGPF